jgi:hypothetical protein
LAGGVPDQQEATMILIVRHTVRDYDAWKPVFDQGEGLRTKYGLLSHTIYHAAEDPNDLTLEFRIESRERAEAIMQDPQLAKDMERGGVISEPLVVWLEKVESVSYKQVRAA